VWLTPPVAYTSAVQINFLTDDETLLRRMVATVAPQLRAEFEEPTYTRGAVQSWWELLADIGAIGLPVGILGNLIATWISDAMKEAHNAPITTLNIPQPSRLKMVISQNGKPVEIEIESDDVGAIRAAVEAGLNHVDQH
jgi:tRNA threonylcarbamoyladenosine modification (KEOPS) complex  Pcc1 subunit